MEYVDTETSTNVPFAVGAEGAGRFTLSLECLATPSNNVEAAFGCDVDHDGVLGLGEIAITIGWDCGAWFMRQGCDGIRIEEPCASTNTAYGWLHGVMTWDIPFGWAGLTPPDCMQPLGVFATSQPDAKSIFTITTNGNFSVSKLGNTAIRARDGRCFLNGSLTTPEER
ncbi:MAG: hypothetical protein IKO72_11085 [Kiritimatiellae bacterium]|nr:hypothetical protein [Kiritimatiellia bacterium]